MNRMIYIAGPMTGVEDYNYPAFHAAAKRLRELGYGVINPAENFGGDQSLAKHVYLDLAFKQVMECDSIALLPGWEKSEGACSEAWIALSLNKWFVDIETGNMIPRPSMMRPIECVERHVECGIEKQPPPGSAEEAPDQEARRLVHGDRNAAYGTPLSDYQKTAKMWSGMLFHKLKDGEEILPQEAVLMMAAMKISRLMHKHKRDSVTDTHGYMDCYWWIMKDLENLS